MSQKLIGLGTAANDGTGDTPRVAGQKIQDNFSELFRGSYNLGTRTVGFLGESNGDRAAKLGFNSWMFWMQARTPRRFNYDPKKHNLAVSGNASGAMYNSSTGAVTLAAIDGTDMNTPIIKAKALALVTAGTPVDDWFLSPNGNDSGNAYSSYRNNREMVDYLRANGAGKRFIFFSAILPKITSPQPYIFELHNYMRAWAASTPDVYYVDAGGLFVDDQSTSYAPTSNAVNYAPMNDEIGHIAPAGASVLGAYMGEFLDTIGGYPHVTLVGSSRMDSYSATTAPWGNAHKDTGVFNGSITPATQPSYFATGTSGETVLGCKLATSNAELTVVGSKVTTLYRGRPHTGLRLNFTATGNLATADTVTCTLGSPAALTIAQNSFNKTVPNRAQLYVNVVGLRDCCGMQFKYTANDGTTTSTWSMGSTETIAAFPLMNESFPLVLPTAMDFSAITSSLTPTFSISWPPGTLAGDLGYVELAMLWLGGQTALPALP